MAPDESADLSVNGWNGEYLESLYEQWKTDPDAVGAEWQQFFRGFELGARRAPEAGAEVAHTAQGRVDSLIYHYRDIGHFAAKLGLKLFHGRGVFRAPGEMDDQARGEAEKEQAGQQDADTSGQ